jgi:hypothetical protein
LDAPRTYLPSTSGWVIAGWFFALGAVAEFLFHTLVLQISSELSPRWMPFLLGAIAGILFYHFVCTMPRDSTGGNRELFP